MMEELEKELGEPLPKDLDSKEAEAFFDAQCKKHKVDCSNPRTALRLIDKLVGRFLETQCLNPTFIIEHPQQMSPLAKYHRSKPGLT
jgi:lysyl-tRNA synthetase class 2